MKLKLITTELGHRLLFHARFSLAPPWTRPVSPWPCVNLAAGLTPGPAAFNFVSGGVEIRRHAGVPNSLGYTGPLSPTHAEALYVADRTAGVATGPLTLEIHRTCNNFRPPRQRIATMHTERIRGGRFFPTTEPNI